MLTVNEVAKFAIFCKIWQNIDDIRWGIYTFKISNIKHLTGTSKNLAMFDKILATFDEKKIAFRKSRI